MPRTYDPITGASLRHFAMVGDHRVQTPTDLGLHATHEEAVAAIGAHALTGQSTDHAKVVQVWVDRDGFFRDPPQEARDGR